MGLCDHDLRQKRVSLAKDLTPETALGLVASSLVVSSALLGLLPRRHRLVVFLLAAVWYWTSALWAAVSKEILGSLRHAVYPSSSLWLTFLPQASVAIVGLRDL